MKLNLTKEMAYDIVNQYIQRNQLNENRCKDIDSCVVFHESFDGIDGFAWAIIFEHASDNRDTVYIKTYVVSDQMKKIERILNNGETYFTKYSVDGRPPNLTKAEVYEIGRAYIKKYDLDYLPLKDINKDITFYNTHHGVEGPIWEIAYEDMLFGLPEPRFYIIPDKLKKITHVLDGHGMRPIDEHVEDEPKAPLLERITEAFTTGTEDEQLAIAEETAWEFQYQHDDEDEDGNIDNFDEIMAILIQFVIENKESEIVENILEYITDGQELQNTTHIDFSVFAENLYTTSGESLWLYIEVLGNTGDARYIPYLLSFKNHEDSEVTTRVELALTKIKEAESNA